jgi:hypothetical protein
MRNFELNFATISEEYRKKWNIGKLNDFVHLVKDGQFINDTLYRVGGIGGINTKDDYFLLLKHTEDYYEDSDYNKGDINKKRHLKSQWCIIDKDGNEKIVFDNSFCSPYLHRGLIYSVDHKYYNIETGYCYGSVSSSMSSDTFIFLNTEFDKDKTKRGVIKINKFDGTFELFQ